MCVLLLCVVLCDTFALPAAKRLQTRLTAGVSLENSSISPSADAADEMDDHC